MRRFVAIEGIDGSGKSVQFQLLKEHLERTEVPYRAVHFPTVDASPYGDMVARFLRGEFGSVQEVNPYLVSLLFALDRREEKNEIEDWISRGFFVLVDRFVYSNVAFQCAKLTTKADKDQLKKWILDLEFGYNRLPRPDLSIVLQVPLDFASRNLAAHRTGSGRTYLEGGSDIHETDIHLQEAVQKEYQILADENDNFVKVDCSYPGGDILPAGRIHRKIIDLLVERNFLKE